MASIDEDELPPPPEEPSTVAGTIMSQVLNVDCTIYPDSTESEAAQVGRLRKAMEAVVDRAS